MTIAGIKEVSTGPSAFSEVSLSFNLGEYRGVNSEVSYAESSRQTGRDDHSLKRWHDLHIKYPDKEDYLELAKEKAQKSTEKKRAMVTYRGQGRSCKTDGKVAL